MLKIITNNQPRLALYGYELPEKVKTQFDYVEDLDMEIFIKFKGEYYWINDFTSCYAFGGHEKLLSLGWIGYTVVTAFSGLVIKQDEYDQDRFIVGQWLDVSE